MTGEHQRGRGRRMGLRLPPEREHGWSQTDNPQVSSEEPCFSSSSRKPKAGSNVQCGSRPLLLFFLIVWFYSFFICIYTFFFIFFSILVFHRILNIVPCAITQWTLLFIHPIYTYRVHLLLLSSQSIPLSPLFLVHFWGQFTPNPLHSGAAPWLKTVHNLRNSHRPNEG